MVEEKWFIYSAKFKAKMVSKMLPPNPISACALEEKVGVSHASLSRWLRESRMMTPMANKLKKEEKDNRRKTETHILQSVFPTRYLTSGTMTFDENGTMYVLATTVDSGFSTVFGDLSHEIVLFTSVDHGTTFHAKQISLTDPTTPNWLPSIERPFGINPIGVPSFLYTHGDKTTGPTDIMFARLQKQ